MALNLFNAQAQDSQLVAEVNSSKILMTDLTSLIKKELGSSFDSFNKNEQHTLLKTSMEKLIERKLLLEEAEKLKLFPKPEEVDVFLASIDNQLGNTSSVKKELEKHGAEEAEFKKGLREELAIKQYLDSKVFASTDVSQAEIDTELKNSAERYKATKQVCARYAEFKIASPEAVAEAETRASTALGLVRENQDFADVARKFSEASNKAKGGDLGCFTENQLPQELSKVAFSLAAEQVSDLVRSKNSFFFIKVEKIVPPLEPSKDQLNERAKQVLLRAKREKLLGVVLEKLKGRAKIIRYFH